MPLTAKCLGAVAPLALPDAEVLHRLDEHPLHDAAQRDLQERNGADGDLGEAQHQRHEVRAGRAQPAVAAPPAHHPVVLRDEERRQDDGDHDGEADDPAAERAERVEPQRRVAAEVADAAEDEAGGGGPRLPVLLLHRHVRLGRAGHDHLLLNGPHGRLHEHSRLSPSFSRVLLGCLHGVRTAGGSRASLPVGVELHGSTEGRVRARLSLGRWPRAALRTFPELPLGPSPSEAHTQTR